MNRRSRRAFLGSAATAAVALAGCTADGTGSDGSGDGGGSTEPTVTSEGSGGGDGLRLETLAVAGSPGGEFSIDPTGTPVLVDFFATWCAPCKPQMAELRAVRERFPDLHMLSLTRETDTEGIASFWQNYEGTWAVAPDPDLAAFRDYGVTGVPVLVVLAPDGTEVWRHRGLAAADSIAGRIREATA